MDTYSRRRASMIYNIARKFFLEKSLTKCKSTTKYRGENNAAFWNAQRRLIVLYRLGIDR